MNITATRMVRTQVSTGNPIFDSMPQFQQFQDVQAQSLGSGFVIHSAGYIITNEHVVEEGTDVQCVFSNGDKLPAQVIATDNEHDLAVLKVTPDRPLSCAWRWGRSEDLMIGEPVYAIGKSVWICRDDDAGDCVGGGSDAGDQQGTVLQRD